MSPAEVMLASLSSEITGTLDKAVRRYGVATVISIALVAFLALVIYQQHQNEDTELKSLHNELHDHMREASFYMRQMCINTSTTEAQRAGCVPRLDEGR